VVMHDGPASEAAAMLSQVSALLRSHGTPRRAWAPSLS
jgi:hypothetical protein